MNTQNMFQHTTPKVMRVMAYALVALLSTAGAFVPQASANEHSDQGHQKRGATVEICHYTPAHGGSWNELHVAEEGWNGHSGHSEDYLLTGDTSCPPQEWSDDSDASENEEEEEESEDDDSDADDAGEEGDSDGDNTGEEDGDEEEDSDSEDDSDNHHCGCHHNDGGDDEDNESDDQGDDEDGEETDDDDPEGDDQEDDTDGSSDEDSDGDTSDNDANDSTGGTDSGDTTTTGTESRGAGGSCMNCGGALDDGSGDGSSGGAATSTASSDDNGEVDTDDAGEVLGAYCTPLLTTYLREGLDNDSLEVMKLQLFLNRTMDSGLMVSGMFDGATTNAVNEFQVAYFEDVLAPWVPFGLASDHTPTGYVYKTTQRQVNLLHCPALSLPMPQLP